MRHEHRNDHPGDPTPIIVFNALCVLCSTNAQFVLRHDRDGHFRLASMQSVAGLTLTQTFGTAGTTFGLPWDGVKGKGLKLPVDIKSHD